MPKKNCSNAALSLLCLLTSAQLMRPAQAAEDEQSLAGTYQVDGREAAAQIMLFPDSRFRYRAAYGGTDAQAEGRWLLRSNELVLVSDQLRAQFTDVAEHQLPHEVFKMDEEGPVLMAVTVKTPKYGLVWSGVEVAYKFADGQIRSGRTNRSGDHGVTASSGQRVVEVGLALPDMGIEQRWFPVQNPQTKWMAVTLDPGRYTQAFKSVSLRINADGIRALEIDGSDKIVNGSYRLVAPLYQHSKDRSARRAGPASGMAVR